MKKRIQFLVVFMIMLLGFTISMKTFAYNANAGANINYFGDYAFAFSKVKKMTVPNSVNRIGNYAFAYSLLENITFGNDSNLQYLDSYVFSNTKLAKITLPKSLIQIGQDIFYETSTLREVYFIDDDGVLPTFNGKLGVNENVKIYVPYNYVEEYKQAIALHSVTESLQVYSSSNLVTYKYMNGTPDDTVRVNVHNVVAEPVIPVKTGYTFIGWYKDGSVYDFSTPVLAPIELVAQYTPDNYTVTFDLNYAGAIDNPDPITATFDSEVVYPTPTRIGHTFTGWFDDPHVGTKYTSNTVYSTPNDLTLYAHWDINNYTLILVENDGSAVDDITAPYDSDLSLPSPQKSGYTFTGWYTDLELTTLFDLTKMPAANMTLYAGFTPNTYTITFNANGGDSAPLGLSVTYDSPIGILPVITREGYSFTGWYTESGTIVNNNDIYQDDGNITLTAHWTINDYTVSFETNGGSNVDPVIDEYGTSLVLPTPTKTGYDFVGWYKDSDLIDMVTSPYNIPANDITLYAKWEIQKFEVIFKDWDGTVLSTQTVDYGSAAVAPSNPTRPSTEEYSYEFAGWDLTYTNVTSSLTITATYTETLRSYTVTFYNEDGSIFEEQTVYYGDFPVIPVGAPSKTGYSFTAWNYENLAITGDLTINPIFTINQYAIMFEENGGSLVVDITQDYDSLVVAPSDPTRLGYTFIGWYTDNNTFLNPYTFTTMPVDGITLYAKWEAIQYDITYELNDGSNSLDNPSTYTIEGLELQYPSKPGYIFAGWYTNSELTEYLNNETIDAGSTGAITLYAAWATEGLAFIEYNYSGYNGYGVFAQNPLIYSTVLIPQEYFGIPVVAINDYAFENNTYVTEVSMPNTIRFIGARAFKGTSIESLTIPQFVDDIIPGAFQIDTLKLINVEEGNATYFVMDNVLYRNYGGTYALFTYPANSNEIAFEISSMVSMIDNYAFAYSNLKSIIVPTSVMSIGSYVFANSDIEEITFNDDYVIGVINDAELEYAINNSLPGTTIVIHGDDFNYQKAYIVNNAITISGASGNEYNGTLVVTNSNAVIDEDTLVNASIDYLYNAPIVNVTNETEFNTALSTASEGSIIYATNYFNYSAPLTISNELYVYGNGLITIYDKITVNQDNVIINGFNISQFNASVELSEASDVKIENNFFTDNTLGINIPLTSNALIRNNTIWGASQGILIEGTSIVLNNEIGLAGNYAINVKSDGNTIFNNEIKYGQIGILIESDNNNISGNIINQNTTGIILNTASNNLIEENAIVYNTTGIEIIANDNEGGNIIRYNDIYNNDVELIESGVGVTTNILNTANDNYWGDYFTTSSELISYGRVSTGLATNSIEISTLSTEKNTNYSPNPVA